MKEHFQRHGPAILDKARGWDKKAAEFFKTYKPEVRSLPPAPAQHFDIPPDKMEKLQHQQYQQQIEKLVSMSSAGTSKPNPPQPVSTLTPSAPTLAPSMGFAKAFEKSGLAVQPPGPVSDPLSTTTYQYDPTAYLAYGPPPGFPVLHTVPHNHPNAAGHSLGHMVNPYDYMPPPFYHGSFHHPPTVPSSSGAQAPKTSPPFGAFTKASKNLTPEASKPSHLAWQAHPMLKQGMAKLELAVQLEALAHKVNSALIEYEPSTGDIKTDPALTPIIAEMLIGLVKAIGVRPILPVLPVGTPGNDMFLPFLTPLHQAADSYFTWLAGTLKNAVEAENQWTSTAGGPPAGFGPVGTPVGALPAWTPAVHPSASEPQVLGAKEKISKMAAVAKANVSSHIPRIIFRSQVVHNS
jgi:hypothetical protein